MPPDRAGAEVLAYRHSCALFDFSFVASGAVRGSTAREDLERFCGRSLARMPTGAIRSRGSDDARTRGRAASRSRAASVMPRRYSGASQGS